MKISALTVSVLLLGILLSGQSLSDSHTADWGGLPDGLGATRNGSDTFTSVDLVATSIQGMLDPSCGGYCVIGACAHLAIRFTWRGMRLYTIVSPRLRHPYPELLVSSYNHAGSEPFAEWRATFGGVMDRVASSLVVAGGRGDPTMLDQHQSGSFKEVDIIGHPLTVLPSMVNRDGTMETGDDPFRSLAEPAPFRDINLSAPDSSLSEMGAGDAGDDGVSDIDIKAMIRSTLSGVAGTAMSVIMGRLREALLALRAISIINDIREMADYFRSIAELMDTISQLSELSVRSSVWGNLISPRFRSPRLFCPINTAALQPYYLSFADFFWWRSGFPVTDGPFGGDNHTLTILNPVSDDTLPVDASAINPLSEVWGRMYPRDGTLDQSHDAKTASVLAWRGMDVLQNSLPGSRVGIPLPAPPREDEFRIGNPKWQMIYPEVKSCEDTPYYASPSIISDFMTPNEFGGYAWNYYRTYTCCSNRRGRHILTITFPEPLCLTLDAVETNAQARAEAER